MNNFFYFFYFFHQYIQINNIPVVLQRGCAIQQIKECKSLPDIVYSFNVCFSDFHKQEMFTELKKKVKEFGCRLLYICNQKHLVEEGVALEFVDKTGAKTNFSLYYYVITPNCKI